MLRSLIAAALLACTTAAFAQSDPGQARRLDCSKAKDPKACEERLAKAKAAHEKARKACEGKTGEERRDCMQKQACAQAADPAKCEARLQERTAQRQKAREACKDKKGEELRSCLRENRKK